MSVFGGKRYSTARKKGEALGDREDVKELVKLEEARREKWSEDPLENTRAMIQVVVDLAQNSKLDSVKLRAAQVYGDLVKKQEEEKQGENVAEELEAFLNELKRDGLQITQKGTD
jgi:HD superfamily phosphohydrolase YqeK